MRNLLSESLRTIETFFATLEFPGLKRKPVVMKQEMANPASVLLPTDYYVEIEVSQNVPAEVCNDNLLEIPEDSYLQPPKVNWCDDLDFDMPVEMDQG